MVKEIMPDCALLFSTRHPKKSMESYMKLFLHENDNWLSSKLFQGWYMNHVVCPYENPDVEKHFLFNPWITPVSEAHLSALAFGGSMVVYQEAADKYDRVVLYENLCKSPKEELKKILSILGKGTEQNVKLALTALEVDAQKAAFGKRGDMFILSDQDWNEVDQIFENLGLPITCAMPMNEFQSFFSNDL